MGFSFSSKGIYFAKAGDIGYLKINDKKIFAIVGSVFSIKVFGIEITNKG